MSALKMQVPANAAQQPLPRFQLGEFFRTPRFDTTVMSTPIAAPNAIHFPMLCVAVPIAAPIAIPRAIPILITIADSPEGAFLPIFRSPVCPIKDSKRLSLRFYLCREAAQR